MKRPTQRAIVLLACVVLAAAAHGAVGFGFFPPVPKLRAPVKSLLAGPGLPLTKANRSEPEKARKPATQRPEPVHRGISPAQLLRDIGSSAVLLALLCVALAGAILALLRLRTERGILLCAFLISLVVHLAAAGVFMTWKLASKIAALREQQFYEVSIPPEASWEEKLAAELSSGVRKVPKPPLQPLPVPRRRFEPALREPVPPRPSYPSPLPALEPLRLPVIEPGQTPVLGYPGPPAPLAGAPPGEAGPIVEPIPKEVKSPGARRVEIPSRPFGAKRRSFPLLAPPPRGASRLLPSATPFQIEGISTEPSQEPQVALKLETPPPLGSDFEPTVPQTLSVKARPLKRKAEIGLSPRPPFSLGRRAMLKLPEALPESTTRTAGEPVVRPYEVASVSALGGEKPAFEAPALPASPITPPEVPQSISAKAPAPRAVKPVSRKSKFRPQAFKLERTAPPPPPTPAAPPSPGLRASEGAAVEPVASEGLKIGPVSKPGEPLPLAGRVKDSDSVRTFALGGRGPAEAVLAQGASARSGLPPQTLIRLRKLFRRQAVLEHLGGNAQTEKAVQRALQWLRSHQSPDGRWDVDSYWRFYEEHGVRAMGGGSRSNEDVGVTGLALLAFLGAGYTHLEQQGRQGAPSRYAAVLDRGISFLLGGQKADGDLRQGGQMYSHAIATTALCEAYLATGDPRLEDPIRKAVNFALKARQPGAGWRYEVRNGSDTSVTAWQAAALLKAELAGVHVPSEVYRGVQSWLDRVRSGKYGGLYAYQPKDAPSAAATAEGLYLSLLLGADPKSASVRESVDFLLKHRPPWGELATPDLYFWYQGTLALYAVGGEAWRQWNAGIRKILPALQRSDGPYAGSWDIATRWGQQGGRVYTTAIAALTLECYYRCLPLRSIRPTASAR